MGRQDSRIASGGCRVFNGHKSSQDQAVAAGNPRQVDQVRFVDDRIIVEGDNVRASRHSDLARYLRYGAINLQPNGLIRQDAWGHEQSGTDLTVRPVGRIEIIPDVVGNVRNPISDGYS